MEEHPRNLEQIREDAENAQRSILWPDNLRAKRATFAFLWHGDPKATPVQRAGLIIFGLFWLSCAYLWLDSFFHSDPEERGILQPIPGIVLGLLAARIFRNAFLRPPRNHGHDEPQS
jgi:hypothetical protein